MISLGPEDLRAWWGKQVRERITLYKLLLLEVAHQDIDMFSEGRSDITEWIHSRHQRAL